MTKPHENCDTCQLDYEFTKANAGLHLYMDYMRANHVVAYCPNGHRERVFVTTQGFLFILREAQLGITFHVEPEDDLKAAADRTWARIAPGDLNIPETSTVDIIPIPRDWLRSLYDTMREFGGES
jgi:hypothetical protein